MESHKLYVKIAHWYYTLGLTQDEIAKRLALTRQKVNQIINSLVDVGIVTIRVNGYEDRNTYLEGFLEQKYNLKQAIVVNSFEGEEQERIFKEVTNAAAQHLERIIQSKSKIGVSWGETLSATISHMQYQNRPNCRVVQLIGAQNMREDALKSDEIARLMADRLDCPCSILYAPVLVDNPQTKSMLMKERKIQRIFEQMASCDIALVGIGELSEDATICEKGLLDQEEIKALREQGFCADICINAVKEDGSGEGSCIADRIVGADLQILKKIPNVVAIACGVKKRDAIISALKSGCIDTLIVDRGVAEYIHAK